MRSEILSKLDTYFTNIPEKESDVVYLMIQMGKFIESDSSQAHFPVLWFYRNWVVHYQLDKKGSDGRQEMLGKLNEAILSIRDNYEQFPILLRDAISLKRLNEEISRFILSANSNLVVDTSNEWFKVFNTVLIHILVDLPLLAPTNSDYVFKEFKFSKPELGHEFEFRIKVDDRRVRYLPFEITVPADLKEFN